jgi:hypothetical protein
VSEDVQHHVITGAANDDNRRVEIARAFPISDDGQDGSESEANAKLIASAPDLLAALEALTSFAYDLHNAIADMGMEDRFEDDNTNLNRTTEIAAARAAIAKAKGE